MLLARWRLWFFRTHTGVCHIYAGEHAPGRYHSGVCRHRHGADGANVILVNNFRDRRDDSAVGKVTIATLWPRPVIMLLYLFGGLGV